MGKDRTLEIIKTEIEKLKSIEYPCDNSQQATGFFNALDRMTDFLSTLESETTYDTQQYTPRPSVGIEDVARVQFASHAKVFDKKRKAVFNWEQFKEVAGIFYGFGKKDHSDTIESEKPSTKDAMKKLDEKIALVKERGTWEGVDVDKYMDEVRGREPEKPINQEDELNGEIKKFVAEYGYERSEDILLIAIVARHFAEWGYLRAAEKYNEIEYNRQRAEEDTPNDLEEAAKKHSCYDEDCEGAWYEPIVRNGFIAGAKWQKEQMISALKNDGDLPIEFIDKFHEIDRTAFQNGQANMKEQMMKEAVEGVLVDNVDGTQEICLHGNRYGEKVHIIIVKEDEK